MSSSQATIPETQKAWITVRKGVPSASLEFKTDWPVKRNLAAGEVLVKVHAAALNPLGYKLMGLLPNFLAKRPYVPEYDFSGTVVSVGPGGSGEFKEGDDVFGWVGPSQQRTTKQGALSEYVATPESAIVKRPSNLTEIEAAGITVVAMAALQALDLAKLEEGQTLFINGGSASVGAYAIQLAKLRGAKVVVTSSWRNEEFVRKLGADEFIDYTKVGPLHEYLHNNPPSTKYNVILEAIGVFDPSLYTRSSRYLAPNGVFVSVGPWPHGLGWNTISQGVKFASAKVFPSFLTGIKPQHKIVMAGDSKEDLRRLAGLLEQGKIKPTVDSVYAFDEVLMAYERLMTSRARGKVTINVSVSSPTTSAAQL